MADPIAVMQEREAELEAELARLRAIMGRWLEWYGRAYGENLPQDDVPLVYLIDDTKAALGTEVSHGK